VSRRQAAGATIIPIEEKPAATSSPSMPWMGPTIGRPSGVIARLPDQAATTGALRRCGETRAARSARRATVSRPSGSSRSERESEVPIRQWPAGLAPMRSETRLGRSVSPSATSVRVGSADRVPISSWSGQTACSIE
jgi:hypothetical protein